ncbi:MAG: Hint domain-containing protein [Paracoccus denitrificans]|uniref:Hint domain-containing protein n=1 Tax=Paracoccus denitrificans TaxID=266 RepID=A0A533HXT9_PARDE|nr:MAG: Hint domain-containing protein [Paracoccus denitrificans]
MLNEAGITLTVNNGGAAVAGGDLTHDNTNVVCFGADALIRTPTGEAAAADLAIGDLVETRDGGPQAIRWIGTRHLDAATLADNPKLRPVRIRAGALGEGLPQADLIVSPQHRMLVRSRIALKMFGAMEVLVAARQLCQIEGIDVADDLDSVTYVHFLFDAHQIVWANGAESESLFTGTEALRSVGPAAAAEIFAIFPELAAAEHDPLAARALVSSRLGRKLVVRHSQNEKPLVS